MRVVSVLVLVAFAGCGGHLRVDDVVREGMRNEVSAIRTARGRRVDVAGKVTAVRPPRSVEQQLKREKRDTDHSASVEMVSEGGTTVTCFLAADQDLRSFAVGSTDVLVGKFYDFQPDMNGKFTVVMVGCAPLKP